MPSAGPREHPDRGREVQRAVGDQAVVQRAAGDQRLDEVGQAALLARAEHGYDVRMRDLLRRGDLALEAPDEHLVL